MIRENIKKTGKRLKSEYFSLLCYQYSLTNQTNKPSFLNLLHFKIVFIDVFIIFNKRLTVLRSKLALKYYRLAGNSKTIFLSEHNVFSNSVSEPT